MSHATQMLNAVHSGSHPGSRHSWRKLNETLRVALSLAIKSEMRFDKDDIGMIHQSRGGVHWFSDGEWILQEAVCAGNASAATSFLRWKGRKRFVVKAEDQHYINCASKPNLNLLCIGSRFRWNNEVVTVTSFNEDGERLTACSYQSARVVHRRYTITPADLKGTGSGVAEDPQAIAKQDERNISAITGWIDDEHCAYRLFSPEPDASANRIAFIEKTPRVQVPIHRVVIDDAGIGSVGLNDEWRQLYKDSQGCWWLYGPKGTGGLWSADSETYGQCPESRAWCDEVIHALWGDAPPDGGSQATWLASGFFDLPGGSNGR